MVHFQDEKLCLSLHVHTQARKPVSWKANFSPTIPPFPHPPPLPQPSLPLQTKLGNPMYTMYSNNKGEHKLHHFALFWTSFLLS